jgi:predicted anti-sigma-YlaC factor YlaD
MSFIYSCREAARLLSLAQDRPLSTRQRLLLGMHTWLCTACRSYGRQIASLDELFRYRASHGDPALPVSEQLSQTARERIRRRLNDDRRDQ